MFGPERPFDWLARLVCNEPRTCRSARITVEQLFSYLTNSPLRPNSDDRLFVLSAVSLLSAVIATTYNGL